MAIKHIVLKSGERLIANAQEMVFEGKTVGYYFEKPCVVSVAGPEMQPKKPGKEKTAIDVSLYPWIPFGKDVQVPIPLDWVVTMVEPVDMLFEMYQKNVLESTSEWNSGMNYSNEDEENGECKTCR